jgi:DNA-3-methyladenine glycosylase II
MDIPLPPQADRAGLDALAAADPDLARVEAEAGPLPWRVRAAGFEGLLHAIVGQQISSHAAAAIWGRATAIPGCLDPERFATIPEQSLRAAGFSRPKIGHARALADAFLSGELAADRLAAMDDEAAIAAISRVRGLGRWTAEIYLLFALQRRDVFPAGDLALRAAAADLKRLDARPGEAALRRIALAWHPHRALAARLLWHWWRHVTGRPATDDLAQPPPRDAIALGRPRPSRSPRAE